MKATEFIKKFGWDEARVCILNCACPEDRWLMRHGDLISDQDFDDLKNLVNAYELVEKAGGIDNAKGICSVEETHYLGCKLPSCDDLKQAIELVESVNE